MANSFLPTCWRGSIGPNHSTKHTEFRQAARERRSIGKRRLICFVTLLLTGCIDDSYTVPRPQDPEDRPYRIETVRFAGGDDVVLAGELTIPIEDGPHKAVIFISGSGPQNRDEALAGHRPFLVLSDHLTRAGYAVLRYDDRGFAESTGSFEDASLRDFADDAAGAFRFLEGHQDIDASGIGFLGHSEGGYIAPSAAQMVDPAFLVFLAGPARPFYDVLATQAVDFMRAEGAEEADSKKVKSQYDAASAILAKSVPLPEIREQLDTYLKSEGIRARDRRSFLDSLATSAIAKSRAGNW